MISYRICPELPVSTTITNTLFLFIIYFLIFLMSFRNKRIFPPKIISIYTVILISSSLINCGLYPIKDFFVGIFIYMIPIISSLFINPLSREKYNRLLKGIISGSFFVLFYTVICGEFNDGVLGRRFSCGSITPSVMSILLLLIYAYGLIMYFKKKKIVYLLYLVFAVFIAIISISKTALVSICVITIIYILITNNFKRFLPILTFSILLFSFFESQQLIETLSNYVEGNGVQSLSGRDVIWTNAFDLGLESPLFGHGYNSIVSKLGNMTHLDNLNQAHNTLIESFVNVGIIGTIVLIFIFIYPTIFCIRYRNELINDVNLLFSFLNIIIFMMRGITEAGCAQATNLIEVSMFFTAVIYIINYKRIRKIL